MNYAERRNKFREILAGPECLTPASVFDPLSARIAERVGYRIGLLGGSVASYSTLAAPDWILLTLTELADQVRRMMRASCLSLMVDADHGYGNALNVMRTVQELEHSGASALVIEDTALPMRFGQSGGNAVISIEEAVGKYKAALAARADPALIIVGRTSALKTEGIEGTVARARAYAATGIDAIFLAGRKTIDQVQAVHEAAKLPVITNSPLPCEELAAKGVRVVIRGHQPITIVAKALRETYMHLFNGGAPTGLKPRMASATEMADLMNEANYEGYRSQFLQ